MRKITLFLAILATGISLTAQIPTIDWQYTTGAPAFGSAAAADLDKDGKLEIVFSTYTNDGRVHCLNAEDGSVSWIADISGCGDVAPLIYDVDGDDTLEVIVNGSCNPTLFCFNGVTGATKWSIASGGGDSPPTVADIDGDGKPEILFGNFSGQVRIVNGEDGSPNKTIQVDNGAIQTAPTLVDVNYDGNLDIIVANYFNDDGYHIYAYDYATSSLHWQHDDTSNSSFHAYHSGAVADLDGDDTLEYVVGRNNGSIRAINLEDGSELWTVWNLTNAFMALTVADLDGDSIPEVVYSNNDYVPPFNDHIGILSGNDGTLEWSYPTTFSAFRGAALSDMDGDGDLDIVTGHFLSKVRAVAPYQGLIWEVDLGNYLPSGLPYHEADHGPVIADFDNDGRLEVFMVAGYGTYTPDSQNTGIAFAIDGNRNSYCPEWLMFRQDVYRSGYISPTEVASSCDTMTLSVQGVILSDKIRIYPNPARDQLFVEGGAKSPGEIYLRLIDLHGRKLVEETNQVAPGEFKVKMDLVSLNLSPGVYMLQILAEGIRFNRKVIINP